MIRHLPKVLAPAALGLLLALASQPRAIGQTVAYWRFENGIDEATGSVVPGVDGNPIDALNTGPFPGGPFAANPAADYIPDVSGNNNRMYSFHAATTGTFSSDIPATPVPRTGAPNAFSWNVTGSDGGPIHDLFEIGTGNVRSAMNGSPQYTVEASFKQTSKVGFQAIVGRDRVPGDSGGGPLASFWFGVNAGDGPPGSLTAEPRIHFYTWSQFGIDITDPGQTGLTHFGVGPVIEQNVWYDTAVVGDGTTYKLYLKKSTQPTYQLIWTGLNAGLGTHNGGWTVGRGQFDGNPADAFKGYIDEVRISNAALSPTQFLGAVPEPATAGLLAAAAGLGAAVRRRRKS